MYLKRLEIQGFKSFADKLVLEFQNSISAIVGPNGSGKSNVSDAIRWALGEQSIRSLRGLKMEDVIFAGTANRRPLNLAEVSLVIDNADMKIPVDYSEITITRRVFRSGESQFLINKTAVRLKDIHELLQDTGIGREGYSIIGQGRIDEILSIKSEDRRNLFEEAAGIVKYKTKRSEAEGRLEAERQNLIRIDDILTELASKLKPLSTQSETAKRFLILNDKLKIIEVNLFTQQVSKFRGDVLRLDEDIAKTGANIQNEKDTQAEALARRHELTGELEKLDAEINDTNAKIQEYKLEAEKKQSKINLARQEIEFCNSETERLRKEITLQERAKEASAQNEAGYRKSLRAAESGLDELRVSLERAASEFELMKEAVNAEDEALEKYRAEHIESLHKTSDIQSEIKRLEGLYEQLEDRKEQLDDELSGFLQKSAELRLKINASETKLADNAEAAAKLNSELDINMSERVRLEALQSELGKECGAVQSELRAAESRNKILSEMEASHEGYYKSVKAILNQRKSNPDFSGIIGAVAELISVDMRYQTAIETALGGALQNIVTENENDTKKAVEYLKNKKIGRATFLPLSTVKAYEALPCERFAAEPGFIGAADGLVACDARFLGIMSSLLGRVAVIDTMDNAIAFCRKHGYRYKTVTLGGELFNTGGSISGGSTDSASSILSRAREIQSLETKIASLKQSFEQKNDSLVQSKLKLSGVIDTVEKLKFRLREYELDDNAERVALLSLKDKLRESEERRKAYAEEDALLIKRISETNRELRELTKSCDDIKTETEGILKILDERRENIRNEKKKLGVKQDEQMALNIKISALNENINSLHANISRIEAEISSADAKINALYDDIGCQTALIAQKNAEITVLQDESSFNKTLESETALKLEKLLSQKEALSSDIESFREGESRMFETLGGLTNELIRLEMRKEQSENGIKKLCGEMWDKYNLTYNQALTEYEKTDMSLSALLQEESLLKNEIKSLGPVNVSAIDEYKALSERHSFMLKQRDDIVSAEGKLRELIKELNSLMKNQFVERVNAISESFGQVFSEMFHGGKAFLRLQDPENALECGIEIVSQPPGKNLQNMMLFSGGERALTAIALLFGILRLKPSPFCILDEIESALDDANVLRFTEYIKNFRGDTQFILITHKKGTMETADTLYGVTMQELGVSKLVSVKLM